MQKSSVELSLTFKILGDLERLEALAGTTCELTFSFDVREFSVLFGSRYS